jgi:hypothetical protein
MTARFPRTRGARISGFPRSSPAGEGAASGSACGCTSPYLPAANICRRSPSSSVCNDGQWSCALYLPTRVGRCLAARQQCFAGEGGKGPLATLRAVTTLESQMKATAATGMSRCRFLESLALALTPQFCQGSSSRPNAASGYLPPASGYLRPACGYLCPASGFSPARQVSASGRGPRPAGRHAGTSSRLLPALRHIEPAGADGQTRRPHDQPIEASVTGQGTGPYRPPRRHQEPWE